MSAELQLVEGEGDTPEESDELVGTTIDARYEVQKVLGEGGMGLVYKARHVVLDKPLALKVLRPDVSRDQEIITRFQQEARSASAIGNQHIIDITDFGTLANGSTYFIMEFLDGTDLTGAIEEGGTLEPVRIVHVAKQLCQALGAAHDAGIVHRDLKPDNIYLIRRGGDSNFVKVLDFGIAKVGGSSSKLTRAGQVFGTPHYMSPEQCAGSGVDHRTDIYALGIIMYEMSTGDVPFDADNLMGILTKHLYEEPVRPRDRNPSIPEELELVILKAIAKQADVRYQTMYELLEDLQRLEQGIGTMAREQTSSFLVESQATMAPSDAHVVQPPTSKTGLIAGLVVMLLAIGGGAAWFLGQGEDPPPVVENDPVPEVEEPVQETTTVEEPTQVGGTETEMQAEPEATVRIESDPAAEVWRGDEFIGTTPVDLPKPGRGEPALSLELRADGYQTRAFNVSHLTSTDVVRMELARARRRDRGDRRSMREQMMVEQTAMTMVETPPEMTPMMTQMMRHTQTEVLDPWADE